MDFLCFILSWVFCANPAAKWPRRKIARRKVPSRSCGTQLMVDCIKFKASLTYRHHGLVKRHLYMTLKSGGSYVHCATFVVPLVERAWIPDYKPNYWNNWSKFAVKCYLSFLIVIFCRMELYKIQRKVWEKKNNAKQCKKNAVRHIYSTWNVSSIAGVANSAKMVVKLDIKHKYRWPLPNSPLCKVVLCL